VDRKKLWTSSSWTSFLFPSTLTINISGLQYCGVNDREIYAALRPRGGGQNPDAQLYVDQIVRFLADEHLNKKGGAALLEAFSWHLVLQDPELPTEPNGYDCGVFVSAFVYFSVLSLPSRRDSGSDQRCKF
jgi:hypothetical protein